MTSTQPELLTVVAHGRPVAVTMLSPPEWGWDNRAEMEHTLKATHEGSIGTYLRQVEDARHPGRPLWDGNPKTVAFRPADEREARHWRRVYDEAATKNDGYYGEGYVVWLVPHRAPSGAEIA
jgi:hypothetical protein